MRVVFLEISWTVWESVHPCSKPVPLFSVRQRGQFLINQKTDLKLVLVISEYAAWSLFMSSLRSAYNNLQIWTVSPQITQKERKWDVITNRMSVNVAHHFGGYEVCNTCYSATEHMGRYLWSFLIVHESLGSLRWTFWDLMGWERYCPSTWPVHQRGFSNGKLHWSTQS